MTVHVVNAIYFWQAELVCLCYGAQLSFCLGKVKKWKVWKQASVYIIKHLFWGWGRPAFSSCGHCHSAVMTWDFGYSSVDCSNPGDTVHHLYT